MSGVVWNLLRTEPENLMVLDAERRLYAALRADGGSYHLVQPAGLDDPRVGDGKLLAGELVCTCPGGIYRGGCWVTKAAAMFEGRDREAIAEANRRGDHAEDRIPWMDAAPGELTEAWGK